MREVSSPRVKLLYDIYHMQIMEGDLIATIRANSDAIGHYHTGGVPGRHQLDHNQEIQYDAVMRAIADSGYQVLCGPRVSTHNRRSHCPAPGCGALRRVGYLWLPSPSAANRGDLRPHAAPLRPACHIGTISSGMS
jgi:hypothetical protein